MPLTLTQERRCDETSVPNLIARPGAMGAATKIHHGGTEITEKGRMARFARQTLVLRALRASVVNLYANAIALLLAGLSQL
jgi:hypothetical protein